MAIQWMGLDGEMINETTAGGIQWMALDGEMINEQPTVATSAVGIGLTNSILLGGGAGGRKLAQ